MTGTRDDRTESLRALLSRLGSPELTLAESEDLRGLVLDLLGPVDGPSGEDRADLAPVLVSWEGDGDGPRRGGW